MLMQDLTANDIKNYVAAEIGTIVSSTPDTNKDAEEFASLAEEVVTKARGMFLWVILAVRSLVVGIDEIEPYPGLRRRLGQLDENLHTLFKQIILERIEPSHRQEVARHLLITSSARSTYDEVDFATVHAIGHQVEAEPSSVHPDIYDVWQTRRMARNFTVYIAIRSRGLFSLAGLDMSPPEYNVRLAHSSLYEFVSSPEIKDLLQEQAGAFDPQQAIAFGLMALLVSYIEGSRDDLEYLQSEILNMLQYVIFATQDSVLDSGVAPLQSMVCLQGLLKRTWECHPSLHLGSLNWWRSLPEFKELQQLQSTAQPSTERGPGFLEYLTYMGLTCFLQHQLKLRHGFLPTCGRPLLFYAVRRYRDLQLGTRLDRDSEVESPEPVELLLQHGANPNEAFEGRTPWTELLIVTTVRAYHWQFEHIRDSPFLHKSYSLLQFLAALNAASHMLHAGADPDPDMAEAIYEARIFESILQDHVDRDPHFDKAIYIISTCIFKNLLGQVCCGSMSLANCLCEDATLLRPRLKELAELVEQEKREKQHGPRVHLGWPGKQESLLLLIPYYMWVGSIALLLVALLKAAELVFRNSRADERTAGDVEDNNCTDDGDVSPDELSYFRRRHREGLYSSGDKLAKEQDAKQRDVRVLRDALFLRMLERYR